MSDAKGSVPKQTIRDYIGNLFAALLMLVLMIIAGFVGYLYLVGKGIDLTDPGSIPDAVIKLSADCEGLKKTIEAGERCEASDDCVMNSSEFAQFNEAKQDYFHHCE